MWPFLVLNLCPPFLSRPPLVYTCKPTYLLISNPSLSPSLFLPPSPFPSPSLSPFLPPSLPLPLPLPPPSLSLSPSLPLSPSLSPPYSPKTTISELFAIMRQWIPQTQGHLTLLTREVRIIKPLAIYMYMYIQLL